MARKIFFGNYKGGVGKTTSTFYLANQFAEQTGKKILILDLDPQCSMSEICARSYFSSDSKENLENICDEETLNYMLDMLCRNKRYKTVLPFRSNIFVKKCRKLNANVNFIPTSLYYKRKRGAVVDIEGLDELVEELQSDADTNILLLHEVISLAEKNYDYIFFDCPPTNNLLTKSAFLISDFYIIPCISDNIILFRN